VNLRFAALPVLCFSASAIAAHYHVEIRDDRAFVKITLDREPSTEFRMPAWAPGDYRIVDLGKGLANVKFSRAGAPVEAQHPSANLWTIDGGADAVFYTVASGDPGIFSENLRITADEAFIQGPAVLGYFSGHVKEPQTLAVTPYPTADAKVVSPLENRDGVFSAPNYDWLVDSPLVMGSKLKVEPFTVAGKPFRIAGFGRVGATDLKPFADVCAKIAAECGKLFGEIPSKSYTFFLDFGGPGGGLEHLDSARLAMWPGMSADRAASFLAHEYFHRYNVKRIRPLPLGPFDYTKPAATGALWWLEGVTDYYAEVITFRAGLKSRQEVLAALSDGLRALARDPDRLKVSARDASLRVWEAGNSSGYGIDYYSKGKLIGWCLDMAIRAQTGGKNSLDDVMLALYAECKEGKPGFAEDRIRELCVRIGGSALGPIYDTCVDKPVELPAAQLLLQIGMKFESGKISADPAASQRAAAIGKAWPGAI
jgi:predicted metalloprotease with PDZ domain